MGASACGAMRMASTRPARLGAATLEGLHSATSAGAIAYPACTASKVSGPSNGFQAMPGGDPNATTPTSSSSLGAVSTASQGPGQLKLLGSAIGTSPS